MNPSMTKSVAISNMMFAFIILSLAGVATAAPPQTFVQSGGSHFLLNGSPFLFNGFNSYWMMNVAADTNARGKVSQVFQQASRAGLTVCRSWAFSDGGSWALQTSPGVYNENMFQALDFVVSEANKYGIRLILSFVNNWKDFGGRPQYVQWARNAGAYVNGDDDFYTHPTIKDYYKNHIKKVVTRVNTINGVSYKDDPTIMAWELINEPRCNADYSGKTINSWVQEMATFVKSLDSNHLLEIGMEGFYGDTMPERKAVNPGYQVGTDFISNHLVAEIDFATIHAYPDNWLSGKSEDDQLAFMERWMWNHWQDSKNILKKPLVMAEFGLSCRDSGYTLNERDSYMGNVYNNIYSYARNGGTMSGSLVWQLMADGMEEYYDGYEIILSQSPSTMGIIARQSHALNGLDRVSGANDDDASDDMIPVDEKHDAGSNDVDTNPTVISHRYHAKHSLGRKVGRP